MSSGIETPGRPESEAEIDIRDTSAVSDFIAVAPDSIVVVDASGTITVANQKALELFGYDEDQLVGEKVDILVLPSLRDAHVQHRDKYREAPRVRRMGDPRSQLIGVRADGSKVPVDIALSPVVVDGVTCTMAVVRDVTERLNVERQQAVMRQRLAIIDDRDRIARDLHDLVIQRLFATGMRLQSALNDPERLKGRATSAISELDETIAVLRESIFRLTAPDETLSNQVSNLLLNHDISVQCDVQLDVDEAVDQLPPALSEHLVPTLTEALSNVVRHARASSVDVDVTIEHGASLSVSVLDDGVGLDPDATPGFGLANLRRRAEQLGGSMEIRRLEDGGTHMVWKVPVEG